MIYLTSSFWEITHFPFSSSFSQALSINHKHSPQPNPGHQLHVASSRLHCSSNVYWKVKLSVLKWVLKLIENRFAVHFKLTRWQIHWLFFTCFNVCVQDIISSKRKLSSILLLLHRHKRTSYINNFISTGNKYYIHRGNSKLFQECSWKKELTSRILVINSMDTGAGMADKVGPSVFLSRLDNLMILYRNHDLCHLHPAI